jgi:hypothetical protein
MHSMVLSAVFGVDAGRRWFILNSYIYTHIYLNILPQLSYTLSLTQIAPLQPPLITSVSNSYGLAALASFSTA